MGLRALHSIAGACALLLLAGCATTEPLKPIPVGYGERPRPPKPAKLAYADGMSIIPGMLDRETALRLEAMRPQMEAAPFAPTPGYDLSAALARAPKRDKAAVLNGWTALGPGNVGGRIRALAIHPTNGNNMWVGSIGGGIWASTDGGASWRAIDDALVNMIVSCIVIDPANPNVMYAGTGEHFNMVPKLRGLGILKSVDGGNTWAQLPGTNPALHGAGFYYVSRIAIQPGNSNVVLAAGDDGVYRSADAGATWSRTYIPSYFSFGASIGAVSFDPNAAANAIAGGFSGQIAFSRDGGVTWTERSVIPDTGFYPRIEPAYAPSVPGLLYAVANDYAQEPPGQQAGRLFRSLDGGANWLLVSQPGHLLGQGGYANAIWVDPNNEQNLVVGGFGLKRSIDGGVSFVDISGPGSQSVFNFHPDQHVIVSQPGFNSANPTTRGVYVGNDGGLHRSSDILAASLTGATWTRLNNGLEVTQFYSGASSGPRIVGGTQDTGSVYYSPNLLRWRSASGGTFMQGSTPRSFTQDPDSDFGGDSGGVAMDSFDGLRIYYANLYLGIGRSQDGGFTVEQICTGLTDSTCGIASQFANFVSPVLLDPTNNQRLYAGAASLWVTDNAGGPTPAWRNIKPRRPSYGYGMNINAIAVSPTNPNVVWVGYSDGHLSVTQDALAATPTWSEITATLPSNRPVTSILVPSSSPDVAYVTWGNDGFYDGGYADGNLQQTLNLGVSWTNLSASLPNVPMFSVVQRPGNANELYVGTANGVYSSLATGFTWSPGNIGPANTVVTQLFWLDANTLGAATFGRSMFKKVMPAAPYGPPNYQGLWWRTSGTESGWGLNITHQADTLFMTWFTYDAAGNGMWLVMPNGALTSPGNYSGTLYRTTGPAFNSGPWDREAVTVTPVGTASFAFSDADNGTFNYTVNGLAQSKPISRQLFSTPVPTCISGGASGAAPNYQDLWWAPGGSESGWGVNVTHQGDVLFATWFTYTAFGNGQWLVMSNGVRTADGIYTGPLYRTRGPSFDATPWNPGAVTITQVGTATFTFSGADYGTFSYSVDGIAGSKAIARMAYAAPPTVCR